jgi:hypothetical protein
MSRARGFLTNNNGFWIGFINAFLYNLYYLQSIIALSLIHPLHKSLGHAPYSSLYLELLLASQFASLITILHGPNGKYRLYCWRSLFTAQLSSNGRPIVARSCVSGMCLPTRCLAMDFRLFVDIQAFRRCLPNRFLPNGHIRYNTNNNNKRQKTIEWLMRLFPTKWGRPFTTEWRRG